MISALLFTALVAAVALERLYELRRAGRNAAAALARGGWETGQRHYKVMQLLHTTFLVAMPLEVWLLDRPFVPALGVTMAVLVAGTMASRYWIVHTLGERWNTRIIVVPGWTPATDGPYRYLRHPNYLIVVVELAALPLVHTAYLTAALFSAANLALLWVRIRAEEAALTQWPQYVAAMADKPRFVPTAAAPPAAPRERSRP